MAPKRSMLGPVDCPPAHALLRHDMCMQACSDLSRFERTGATAKQHHEPNSVVKMTPHGSPQPPLQPRFQPVCLVEGRRVDICTHSNRSESRSHVIGLVDRCGRSRNGRCATWASAITDIPSCASALHTISGGSTLPVCGVESGRFVAVYRNIINRTFAALIRKRRTQCRLSIISSTQPTFLQACLIHTKGSLFSYLIPMHFAGLAFVSQSRVRYTLITRYFFSIPDYKYPKAITPTITGL